MKRHEALRLDVFGDNWTMLDVTATLRDGLLDGRAPERFRIDAWAWTEISIAERAFRSWLALVQQILWADSLTFARTSAASWIDTGPLSQLARSKVVVPLDELPEGSHVDGLEAGLITLLFDDTARRRRRDVIRRYQETGDPGDPDTARLVVGSPRAAATAELLDRAWAPHTTRAAFVDHSIPQLTRLLKDDTGHEMRRERRVILHRGGRGQSSVRRATASLGCGALKVLLETTHADDLPDTALQARDHCIRQREVLADLFGWIGDAREPPDAGWEDPLNTALPQRNLQGSDAMSLTGWAWMRTPLSTEDTNEPLPARVRILSGRIRADERFVEAAEHFARLFDESRTSVGRSLLENARRAASARAWVEL